MGIAAKFAGGIIMTLLYVIVVPYVTSTYITPYIVDMVGDSSFLYFSSETLIQILILLVTLGFILLLGGGAILRWCGIFGILGMIVAYWLLGDVTKAIFPIVSIIIVFIILLPFKKKKDKKKKDKASKSSKA